MVMELGGRSHRLCPRHAGDVHVLKLWGSQWHESNICVKIQMCPTAGSSLQAVPGGPSPQCPGGSRVRPMVLGQCQGWVGCLLTGSFMLLDRTPLPLNPGPPFPRQRDSIHALQSWGKDTFISSYCKACGYFSDQADFWERVNGKSC